MFRPALGRGALARRIARTPAARRWASSVPADRSRGWKSSAVRWGLAGTIVYFYNTSNLFADDGRRETHASLSAAPTEEQPPRSLESFAIKSSPPSPEEESVVVAARASATPPTGPSSGPDAGAGTGAAAADLESEAASQGAYNEETGEINWDCPCLGGMAHGPCGEQFKAAFSCFVYSKEEPKGVDCIDKFKGMQECFREYPDVYGGELEDDETLEGEQEAQVVREREGESGQRGKRERGTQGLAKEQMDQSNAQVVEKREGEAIGPLANETGRRAENVGEKHWAGDSATARVGEEREQFKQKLGETSESEAVVPKA